MSFLLLLLLGDGSLDEVLIRQHDGAVELVRQTTVSATDHHDADDELAKGLELAAERHVDRRVAEAQSHVCAGGC